MTNRDFEIIEFLTKYKVASLSTLQYFFFPSLSTAQKRMKILYDNKKVSRVRDFINNEYVYFIKKPRQFNHSVKVTETYVNLSKKYNIVKFILEPKLNMIRPDALIGYVENNKSKIMYLEVELSNKGFDSNKYKRFLQNGINKEFGLPNYCEVWIERKNDSEIVKFE